MAQPFVWVWRAVSLRWAPHLVRLPAALALLYAGTAALLAAATPCPPQVVLHLPEPLLDAVFSPDGGVLVFGSWSRDQYSVSPRVYVWDRRSERTIVLHAPEITLRQLLVAPGRAWAVQRSYDDRVESLLVWDLQAGTALPPIPLGPRGYLVSTPRFGPDGHTLAYSTADKDRRTAVVVRDLRPGGAQRVLPGQCGPLEFSPDGHTLAATSSADDCRVRLWDLTTGSERGPLDQPPFARPGPAELSPWSTALSFSADGRTLGLVGHLSPAGGGGSSAGQLVRAWEVATGRLLVDRHLPEWEYQLGGDFWESRFFVQQESAFLTGPRGPVRLLDVATGAERYRFALEGECLNCHPILCGMSVPDRYHRFHATAAGRFFAVSQHRDGRQAAAPGWRDWLTARLPQLRAWLAPASGETVLLDTVRGTGTALPGSYVAVANGGSVLATQGEDRCELWLWDLPPRPPWPLILGWAAAPPGLVLLGVGVRRAWRARRPAPVTA